MKTLLVEGQADTKVGSDQFRPKTSQLEPKRPNAELDKIYRE